MVILISPISVSVFPRIPFHCCCQVSFKNSHHNGDLPSSYQQKRINGCPEYKYDKYSVSEEEEGVIFRMITVIVSITPLTIMADTVK